MYDNDNIFYNKNQLNIQLQDITPNGKKNDWKGKKLMNLKLADSYERLGMHKKAERTRDCGTILDFKINSSNTNEKRLIKANFCKGRLCSTCSWRRSLKIFHQVSVVMTEIMKDKEYVFAFLTLTVENVKAENLSESLDKLFYGFNKLTKRKEWKNAVKGFFRALEVTHNTNKYSKSYDTYHPHFHVILVLDKTYFRSKNYIKQKQWTNLWRECMQLDYEPIVHIEKSYNTTSKNIAEVSKYTVKDKDYIIVDNEPLTDSAVYTLDGALKSRRLCAFGGVMLQTQKRLKLKDINDDDDLINTDGVEVLRQDVDYIIARYSWNVGFKNYILHELHQTEKDCE